MSSRMLWRILEGALSSAIGRSMRGLPAEALVERIRKLGELSDEDATRLCEEVRRRFDDVEREGRELRTALEKTLSGLLEQWLLPEGLLRAASGARMNPARPARPVGTRRGALDEQAEARPVGGDDE